MKRSTKTALLVAACLIGAGLLLSTAALAAGADMDEVKTHVKLLFKGDGGTDDKYEGNFESITERQIMVPGGAVPAADIRNLKLELGATETRIVTGNEFAVRATGKNCTVRQDGDTLKISTKKRWIFPWWKTQRVEIQIPAGLGLDELKIEVGAGSLQWDAPIECRDGKIELGAGKCRLENLTARGNFTVECGMGSVNVNGAIDGDANIECGMGQVSMNLSGDPHDYAYTAEVGMGRIKINDMELNGIGEKSQSPAAAKHRLTVECGMGSVDIRIGG